MRLGLLVVVLLLFSALAFLSASNQDILADARGVLSPIVDKAGVPVQETKQRVLVAPVAADPAPTALPQGVWFEPVVNPDGSIARDQNGQVIWRVTKPLPMPTPRPLTMAEEKGTVKGYLFTCYGDASCAGSVSGFLREFSLWDKGGAWFILNQTGFLDLNGCSKEVRSDKSILVTCSPRGSFSLRGM